MSAIEKLRAAKPSSVFGLAALELCSQQSKRADLAPTQCPVSSQTEHDVDPVVADLVEST